MTQQEGLSLSKINYIILKKRAIHQLATMVKATDGLDLEKGQAHSIVQEKSQSGMHVHIGQYLFVRLHLDWLNEIDPDSNFV